MMPAGDIMMTDLYNLCHFLIFRKQIFLLVGDLAVQNLIEFCRTKAGFL